MCEPLDLKGLDKETVDRLEIKEDQETTFDRVIDYDYTDQMFQTIEGRRSKATNHSYITTWVGQQGSSKSWSAISVSGLLDDKFSVDRIFFSYDDLVNKRKLLKEHCAVLVDEQTASFGMDSNRVMIILNALKEQLRKKSIHMAFCSPTLHSEYQSSMYVFETLFINYDKREAVAAYKTRDLHCLGHVHIPSPEKIVGKDFMKAYEEKKDAHLDRLTGQRSVDEIEERAQLIMSSPLFKSAELIYLRKRGFIPMNMLMQVVGKVAPEYKQSIIAAEIASRIKLDKELMGQWRVAGGA
jgi:hypothetical protein